jgi:hypothetical protein
MHVMKICGYELDVDKMVWFVIIPTAMTSHPLRRLWFTFANRATILNPKVAVITTSTWSLRRASGQISP